MKRFVYPLSIIIFVLLHFNSVLQAQESGLSNYLRGAVPETDGKVVFKKSFKVPGVSCDSLIDITKTWVDEQKKPEDRRSANILIEDKKNGTIIARFKDKLVFKSSLLYIDQADIDYHINATCKDGGMDLEIMRIRYDYQKDERFYAEDIITDKASLDKEQKSIHKQSYKWRVKTIDFVNDIFNNYKDFLVKKIRTESPQPVKSNNSIEEII